MKDNKVDYIAIYGMAILNHHQQLLDLYNVKTL